MYSIFSCDGGEQIDATNRRKFRHNQCQKVGRIFLLINHDSFKDFTGMQDYQYLILFASYSSLICFIRLSVKGRNRNLIRQSSGTIYTSRNRSSSMTDSSDSESDTRSEEEYLEN